MTAEQFRFATITVITSESTALRAVPFCYRLYLPIFHDQIEFLKPINDLAYP